MYKVKSLLESFFLPRLFASAFVVTATLGVAAAQESTAVISLAQVESGLAVYEQGCAGCHGVDLEGSGGAPALVGGTFRLIWGPKMVSELFGVILQTMPPTSPGSLDENSALTTTAYILQRNGAAAGDEALTSGETTLISAIATGDTPADVPSRRRAEISLPILGAGSTAGYGRGADAANRGITQPDHLVDHERRHVCRPRL